MLNRRFPRSCWCYARIKRTILFLSFTSIIFIIVLSIFLFIHNRQDEIYLRSNHIINGNGKRPIVQYYPDNQNKYLFRKGEDPFDPNQKELPLSKKPPKTDTKVTKSISDSIVKEKVPISYEVHTFYYAWYASPEFDGQYSHWNHKYIPNWDRSHPEKDYPNVTHQPPDDIGSNFYPQLGPYSSKDPKVLSNHMKQIRNAGIGVLVVSWYPPGMADENGLPSDSKIPILLDAAEKENLKIAIHVEPYNNINPENFRKNLKYIHEQYFDHPAFYKRRKGERYLPVIYVYDSYRVTPQKWQRVLKSDGDISVRGTDLDAIFLGLVVEMKHRYDIRRGGFDGFYTYFAANGFSYGSSWKNWDGLAKYARQNSLIFVPSVGPGYVDTRVRAWNGVNSRQRRNGAYYDMSWKTALNNLPQMVSITSFNEWGEGTQIEAAIPKQTKDHYTYLNYLPQNPDFYINATAKWVKAFIRSRNGT